MHCLAVCAPGIEPILTAELTGLGIRPGRTIAGGVTFPATTRQLYAANTWLRTASRVLVRVAHVRAVSFAELEQQAAEVEWGDWVAPGARPTFRVTSHGSRLYHTGAIAERLAKAAGGSSAEGTPEQLVVVRASSNVFTISVDSSGEHLHRRGWRLATAKAPFRETLAAAMVLASGWDRTTPFVDPMCGSGTIAIEAALLAAGRAPGAGRGFAFQQWPSFAPGTWASVRADVERAEHAAGTADLPPIVAADRDAGAIRIATQNAERAGTATALTLRRAAIAETLAALPSPAGSLVTNPPYGARVGGADLRDLYATIGRAQGWNVGLLAADAALARHTGLALVEGFRTKNGGIPVTFFRTQPRSGE